MDDIHSKIQKINIMGNLKKEKDMEKVYIYILIQKINLKLNTNKV
jgi:hypothetical protein